MVRRSWDRHNSQREQTDSGADRGSAARDCQTSLIVRPEADMPLPGWRIGPAHDREWVGRRMAASSTHCGRPRILYSESLARVSVAACTVVIVGFHHPNREIFDELAASVRPAHMVGHVLGRRYLTSALHSAAEVRSRG